MLRSRSFRIVLRPGSGKLRKFGTYNVGWVGARNDARRHCGHRVGGGRNASSGVMTTSMATALPTRVISIVCRTVCPGQGRSRIRRQSCALEFRQLPDRFSRRHGDDRRTIPADIFPLPGREEGWSWFIFNSHRMFRAPFSSAMRNHIYKPYVDELLAIERSGRSGPAGFRAAKPHRRSACRYRADFRSQVRIIRSARFNCWIS